MLHPFIFIQFCHSEALPVCLKAFVFGPGYMFSTRFAGQVLVNDGAADHFCSDHIIDSGIAYIYPGF
jgi:hypothetical protein